MKIMYENSLPKKYVEVLPSISVSWSRGTHFGIYIAWLFWSIMIDV